MQDQYGIIGYPLSHSYSPAFFNKKFEKEGVNAIYTALPIPDIALFPQLLEDYPRLKGLNVTIPYKQTVMPYLDELNQEAEQVGAVNCIAVKNGKTKGYNTDVIGFERSLGPLLLRQHTHALILGTGGASKAVAYVLKQKGIAFKFVSRKPSPGILTYEDVTPAMLDKYKFIINTTPLGMYVHINECPDLPYEAMGSGHLVYDLVYNPAETKFLSNAGAAGAITKNGLDMLHLQAMAGWEIWNASQ